MAIYHASMQVIGRQVKDGKTGQPVAGRHNSVVAAAAYRSGLKLRDETYDCTHDYTGKLKGIAHSEILTPDGAPGWMRDPEKLWNAVEASEKRKDAQLAREGNFALPVELTPEENIALARGFAQRFVDRGMVAQVSIHEPQPDERGQRNPHFHLMLTMRNIEGDGFGNKNREWNGDFGGARPDGAELMALRKDWADQVNAALEKAGHESRIDHRSLKEQGVDKLPSVHLGKEATALRDRGERSKRLDEQKQVAVLNMANGFEAQAKVEKAKKRRRYSDLDFHADRIARGAAKANREILHDHKTDTATRGKYTKKEAIDRAGHSGWAKQVDDSRKNRSRELEPER